MSNLAIKGHQTRGKEVIEILEMMGGKNPHKYIADCESLYFYIGSDTEIIYYDWLNCPKNRNVYLLTIEEFLEKFPYKVGDKVTHNMGILMNVVHIYWDAKCNVIRYDIQSPVDNNYKFKAMLAEHLQPYKEETMEDIIKIDIPKGYEFAGVDDDNQQVVFEKICYQYPKTHLECCDVLGRALPIDDDVEGYKWELIMNFQRLLVCRDAYWKLAGEEMGLGKPWEPDWENANEIKYCIANTEGNITKWIQKTTNKILAFPTEEMRDAFYESFKDSIELCKELL